MRLIKLVIVIVCLSLFFTSFNTSAAAQTTYEQLLDNYQAAFDVYKQSLDEYNFARAEYLKYQTPVSADTAISATKKFLNARQQVMIHYLRLIKERLEQSTDITEEELKPRITYINEEIIYLQENQPFFDTAKDLNDLQTLSKIIERRYGKFLEQTYRMKGLIIIGKIRSLRKTGQELVSLTGEQVARLKKENIVNTLNMERWLLDAPRKILLSETKETEAVEKFNKITPRTNTMSMDRFYGDLQNGLRDAIQYLNETNQLLFEIIRDIRFD